MKATPPCQPDALSAGRRVYLGATIFADDCNLPYTAKPCDIEEILATHRFGDFEKIHISIDPVSARNPGYCFVDFPDSATADRALTSLSADISGRPIKVGPCKPKKQLDRRSDRKGDFAFNRCGDWTSRPSDSENTIGQLNGEGIKHGPHGALDHFDDMVQNSDGRRLYVGGLGQMVNQYEHQGDIAKLFAGFTPTAIGKRITPHESTRSMPGNHHCCFVDFATREETNAAMTALNGRPVPGGKLKISLARGIPKKLVNRSTDVRDSRRVHDGGNLRSNSSRPENIAESNRSIASSNWRRKDND